MASCESIRPLLFKMAEREVSPREAMRTASHLAGCTACKILLARERRLARMLEVDLQDIPVGEDFFQSVMDSIPEDPPPAQAEEQKRKSRNGMKLAGFAGLIGAGALLLSRMTLLQGSPGFMSALPSTDLEGAPGSLEGLFDVVRLVLVALHGMTAGVSFESPLLAGNLGILGGAAAAVLLLLGTGSAIFALVARCWVWPSR
jgi:anti-sigma factor RsiW